MTLNEVYQHSDNVGIDVFYFPLVHSKAKGIALPDNTVLIDVDKIETTEEEKEEMGDNKVTVPDVVGEGLDEAIGILGGEGLEYEVSAGALDNDFIVQDQYPKAGSKIEKGGTVYLYRE